MPGCAIHPAHPISWPLNHKIQHAAGNPGSEDHWWDLCAGPHVDRTGDIPPDALDLESVAGALTF